MSHRADFPSRNHAQKEKQPPISQRAAATKMGMLNYYPPAVAEFFEVKLPEGKEPATRQPPKCVASAACQPFRAGARAGRLAWPKLSRTCRYSRASGARCRCGA